MIRQAVSDRMETLLDRARLRRSHGPPSQIHLSVTDRCFLPCLHCDIWKNDATDLPGRDWLDLIDRLGSWCAPAGMNLVGGEPLLRKDLEELVSRAAGHGFTVSFNTNGWLVTAERARSIAQAGAATSYVSMDGFLPETVDHSRGRKGSYDKCMEAIDHFRSQPGLKVVVAAILHSGNAGEFSDLLDWVEREGMQLVVQPLYQNFGYVEYDKDWWRSSPFWPKGEEELEVVDAALDMLALARQRGRPVCNEIPQLKAMKFHFRHPSRDSGLSCRAGHSDLSIDPQGRIRLCYFLEPVGSIFDPRPLPETWSHWTTLRRRWEVSRCERHCNLLNCNFETV